MWKICIVFLLFLINCKTTEFNYEGCTDPLSNEDSGTHNNGNCKELPQLVLLKAVIT